VAERRVTSPYELDAERRAASYRKDREADAVLTAMNEALAGLEPEPPADLPAVPYVFVFGVPRSGTTLCYQALAWALDVGYVSSLMARYWLAPYTGAMVARSVLGDARDDSFRSSYGRPAHPAGPHEFSYFWTHWLGLRQLDDFLDYSGRANDADWPGLQSAVERIQLAFESKPLVFKTTYAGQFLPDFAEHFPTSLFVQMRRDPVDTALSILEARRRIYGDVDTWWSTFPPEYAALRDQPFAQQIAGQVLGVERAYERLRSQLPAGRVLVVDYDELCATPSAVLERVRERCLEVHGVAPDHLNPLPDRFHVERRAPEGDEAAAVADAVQAQSSRTFG
jgi:hypothetical protein